MDCLKNPAGMQMKKEEYKVKYDFFVNEGFIPLDKNSYQLFRKYNSSSMLLEKAGLILVTWYLSFFGLYKIINDCLCSIIFLEGRDIYWIIHRPQENNTYPLQPIIDSLCELCKRAGLPFLQIKFIDTDILAEYEAVKRHDFETTFCYDNDEYAYKVKDLQNLTGGVNYYKRKRVKRLINNPDISICPMTNDNVQLCLKFQDEWCAGKDCVSCASYYGCEKNAIKVFIEIFDDKIHQGLFLYDAGKLHGYIACERICDKLSILYFGKSNIDGGMVYLIYTMYKDYINDCEYMNIGEDMGHEGLRRYKKLLSSYELWRKYVVTYSL
jgi:hypothetical protein